MCARSLFSSSYTSADEAVRRIVRLGMTHLTLLAGVLLAQEPAVTLRVKSSSVVPGGWAQIQVYADSPALITRGFLSIDLDARLFGPIDSASTFSATGDAFGILGITGTHLEAMITSASGGIGQLPGVPVLVIRAPVLADGPASGSIALSLPPSALPWTGELARIDYPREAWTGPAGVPLTVQLVSGVARAGGTLSIQSVAPNSGLHAAGTALRLTGAGFTPATSVTAAGATFSKVTVLSSAQIEATLASSRELSVLKIHLQSGLEELDFFPAAPSTMTQLDSTLPTGARHAVLPLTERSGMAVAGGNGTIGIVLSNPYDQPVEVETGQVGFNNHPVIRAFTLPPSSTRFFQKTVAHYSVYVRSPKPLRMARYYELYGAQLTPPLQNPDFPERLAPQIASVANGASQGSGLLSPGEVVTIRGIALASSTFGVRLDGDGRISSTGAAGERVLIGGIPAPILYGSPSQWNVVAPYEIDGRSEATIQFDGGSPWKLGVTPLQPGMFTIGATGVGGAAALNQDNTVNSPQNPAPRGTIVQVFATGLGQTVPASTTGSIAPGPGGLAASVKLRFGGTDVVPTYAGPAPQLASGVAQINAVVPPLGPNDGATREVPLKIVVDGVESPSGVTVSVMR